MLSPYHKRIFKKASLNFSKIFFFVNPYLILIRLLVAILVLISNLTSAQKGRDTCMHWLGKDASDSTFAAYLDLNFDAVDEFPLTLKSKPETELFMLLEFEDSLLSASNNEYTPILTSIYFDTWQMNENKKARKLPFNVHSKMSYKQSTKALRKREFLKFVDRGQIQKDWFVIYNFPEHSPFIYIKGFNIEVMYVDGFKKRKQMKYLALKKPFKPLPGKDGQLK